MGVLNFPINKEVIVTLQENTYEGFTQYHLRSDVFGDFEHFVFKFYIFIFGACKNMFSISSIKMLTPTKA